MGIGGPVSNNGTKHMLQFDRIQHLFSPDHLHDSLVLQVGVGSGGAPVSEHLTMNGVRRWVLFDPDTYDEINLVKHPYPRSAIGQHKVEIQKNWILDRNPSAEVEARKEDVMNAPRFRKYAKEASLILCCADTQHVRLFVNSLAVEVRTPCVSASVFRRGFGGEVYAYVPDTSGCFDCMVRTAEENGWNIDESIDLIQEERDAIYGLNLRDFKASGLSLDIQSISLIQARVALDILLRGSKRAPEPVRANWIIFYNRSLPNNTSTGYLRSQKITLKPRRDCKCGTHAPTNT